MNSFETKVIEAGRIYRRLKIDSGCKNINALPTKADPRQHHNWKYFVATVELCDGLGITAREYLRCVLWRSVDELNRHQEVHPSMLPTKWAIDKWKKFRHQMPPEETPEKFREDSLAAIRLGIARLHGLMLQIFGEIVPLDIIWAYRDAAGFAVQIRWIASGSLSMPYLSLSKAFWRWLKTIPESSIDGLIDVKELKSWRRNLFSDVAFIQKAQKIMKDDL